jgi:hypothetical protein
VLAIDNGMPHHDRTMNLKPSTKAWLDTLADGSDHEALNACEIFAALETRDGRVSAECGDWLTRMAKQRRYPLVRVAASEVLGALESLRGAA